MEYLLGATEQAHVRDVVDRAVAQAKQEQEGEWNTVWKELGVAEYVDREPFTVNGIERGRESDQELIDKQRAKYNEYRLAMHSGTKRRLWRGCKAIGIKLRSKRKEGKMSLVPVYVIDGVIDPEIKYLTTSKRLSSPPNEGECYSPPRLPKSAYHLPRATDIAKRGVPEGDLSLRRPGFLSTVAVAGSLPSNTEVLKAMLQLPGAKLGDEATFMDIKKQEVMRFGWTGLDRMRVILVSQGDVVKAWKSHKGKCVVSVSSMEFTANKQPATTIVRSQDKMAAHLLMLRTFCGEPVVHQDGTGTIETDHINGDKHDFRLCNLRWVSKEVNCFDVKVNGAHVLRGNHVNVVVDVDGLGCGVYRSKRL